jgi:murein DD-endopeptidase MepM/ murein hydrolase activator NlpD
VRRALVAGATVLALVVAAASPAAAGDPVKARKDAQSRANEAAARFARASSDLARVESQLAALEARAKTNQETVDALQQQVKGVAINAYLRGGTDTALVFNSDIGKVARGQAMARYVALGNTESLDAYRAARQDLVAGRQATNAQLASRRTAADALRKKKADAYRELDQLAKVERDYLAKVDAERRAAQARQAASNKASRSLSAAAVDGPVGVIASGAWICPVQGPHAFSNDYGQPRPGGRTHQGNDILAARGTPIVANVAGDVARNESGRGGLSYFLHGVDGNTYFGAHMSGYAATGQVAAGTVIGYVGDTGDARGTPHLHFEIHPGGGGPVNPYATLRTYC